MQVVEQTIINKDDPRYDAIDAASFAAKNLYNLATYEVRQSFIIEGKYLGYGEVYHLVKHMEAYRALPAKASNDILRQVDKAWRSFFAAIKEWREHPEKFTGRPKLPKYKHKTKGRFLLIYDKQALSKKALKRGKIAPSGLGIEIPTSQGKVQQARIVPRNGFYVLEVVYERAECPPAGNPNWYASIDLGVDNLAAIRFITPGWRSSTISSQTEQPGVMNLVQQLHSGLRLTSRDPHSPLHPRLKLAKKLEASPHIFERHHDLLGSRTILSCSVFGFSER